MSSSRSNPDYTGVTETPGIMVSRQAASMAISRYEVVRRLAAGRRVLEVACGSGQGLGYVARSAASIVGGDITAALIARARAQYQGAVPLVQFDAHALPFRSGTFDIVQVHEAIYYMRLPLQVFGECRRVLAPGGLLVVSSINPEWPDFNPSPQAARYFAAADLKAALENSFPTVDITFGFAVRQAGIADRLLSLVKRAAVRWHLIPTTMRGKTLLKRALFGPLMSVPPELTPGFAAFEEPQRASLTESSRFRIIYAVART